MKKKEIKIKRNLLLAFVLLFALQINFMDAKAADGETPWGVTNADWTASVKATARGTAYFSVNKFERDAEAPGAQLKLNINGVVAYVSSSPISKVAIATTKKGDVVNAMAGSRYVGDRSYVRGSGIFYY